jgi:hypothetical protein
MGNKKSKPRGQAVGRTALKSAMIKLGLNPRNPDDFKNLADFCANLARRRDCAANIPNFGSRLLAAFQKGRREITVPSHIAAGIAEVDAFRFPGPIFMPQPAAA